MGVAQEAGNLDVHKGAFEIRVLARALYNPLFAVDINGNVSGELHLR